MHRLWRYFIICTLITLGSFQFIFYSETGKLPIPGDHLVDLLLVLVFANAGAAALYFLNLRFNKLIPWYRNRSVRFFAETLTGFILFVLLGFLFYYGYLKQVIPESENRSFWAEYWDGAVKLAIICTAVLYLTSLVNFLLFSYNQYAVYQIEALQTEREQANFRFEALKSQLSPHFLFNSLNTISSLMYKDIKISENFIRKLATSFHYVLKTENRKLVDIKEELEMVKAFFYLQKIKYEDCVALEISLTPALVNSMVPPLALQMLVENAFKHNLICEEEILKIEIFDEEGKYIVVRNNFIRKPELLKIGNNLLERPPETASHKIGLNNIRKRYKYLSNKEVEIFFNDYFTVKLPVIIQENEEQVLL